LLQKSAEFLSWRFSLYTLKEIFQIDRSMTEIFAIAFEEVNVEYWKRTLKKFFVFQHGRYCTASRERNLYPSTEIQ